MTDLKIYTATVAYDEFPETGTWMGVVMAPDLFTAERLFGQQILIDNDTTLAVEGFESFGKYYNSLDEINSWEGLNGKACPCCQSHDTKNGQGGLGEWGKPVLVCNACAYQWIPIGFNQTMQKSAAQAWQMRIDILDEEEAASLLDDDEDEANDPID